MKTDLNKIVLTLDHTGYRLVVNKYEAFVQKNSYLIHRLDNDLHMDITIPFSKVNILTSGIRELHYVHNYYIWSLEEHVNDNIQKLKEHIAYKVNKMYANVSKQLDIVDSIEFLNDKGGINAL